jgi:hypothetical protein
MIRFRHLAPIACAFVIFAADLSAQNRPILPRAEQQLNRNTSYSPVSLVDWDAWYIISPDQALPASPTIPGSVPTGRLVHAFVPALDPTIGRIPILAYRRSTDGGLTWEQEQNIFQLQPRTEWWAENRSAQYYTDGHKVFAVLNTSAYTNSGTTGVVVVASFDQGQTWQPPQLVTPFAAGPNPQYVRSKTAMLSSAYVPNSQNETESGVFHLAYEVGQENAEDIWYTAFKLSLVNNQLVFQTVNREVRINTGTKAYTVDCDWPHIAAQGNVVHVCWSDGRLSTNTDPNVDQDTWTRTSKMSGQDLHLLTSRNETNFQTTAPPGWSPRRPYVAVSIPNIYTFLEHSQGGGDQIYLSYSNDLGQNWNQTIASTNPTGTDLDGFAFWVDRQDIYIAWRDDRAGQGNNLNHVYYVHDRLAGKGFGTPAVTEVPLSVPLEPNTDIDAVRNIEVHGQVAAIAVETNCAASGNATGGGDGVAVFWTADGQKTWNFSNVSSVGACTSNSNDVDTPYVAVSAYGDINLIWIDDRDCASNACNNTYVAGIRSPYLVDRTANSNGLDLVDGGAFDKNLALLLISSTGATPGLPLPNGMQVNVAIDNLTVFGLGFPGAFISVMQSSGTANFPAIPNLGKILGAPVTVSGVMIDNTTLGFVGVIDPITLQ